MRIISLYKWLLLLVIIPGTMIGCSKAYYKIPTDFDPAASPPKPDYTRLEHWAAHPAKADMADRTPRNAPQQVQDKQAAAQADVFFIHPTIYTYEPANTYLWNADVNDAAMNKRVDESTILNQASIFNGSCRVFAPRYRQAHYSVFTTSNPKNKEQGLAVAYQDVKAAFEYYLKNENKGRPIVIAAHSQGTLHAGRLLREFFDGKPLHNQLVTAYLVGIATPPDYFQQIRLSDTPTHLGGFTTWTTFQRDFYPKRYQQDYAEAACVNPLTWRTDSTFAHRDLNVGGVGPRFRFIPRFADAQVNRGILWINTPYIFGRSLVRETNWHRADMNLFWMNIRENVALRIETFLKK